MKNSSIKTLKKKLWQLCHKIAEKLYPNSKCYTCDALISGQNKQLGHLIPSSICGAFLRYDVKRNLRWQCARCNLWGGGNGAEFYKRMVKEVGQKAVDKLFADKNIIVKADKFFYLSLIKEYEEILKTYPHPHLTLTIPRI